MVSLTLSIPKDLKKKMEEFSEINWSEVARKAIIQKIADLAFLKEFKEHSTLSEQDAIEMGKKVSEGILQRYIKD